MRNLLLDILLIFVFPSLIASIIHKKLIKHSTLKEVYLQYALIVWIGVALMKIMLGKGTRTVLESFESNGIRTYIHWMGPVLLIAVLAPMSVKLISGKNKGFEEWLRGYASIGFTVFSLFFLIIGHITNMMVLIGTVLSLLIQTCLKITKVSIYKAKDRQAYMTQVIRCIGIFGFWAASVYIFIPIRLYLFNQSDFSVSFNYFSATLICAAVFITFFFVITNVVFVPKPFSDILLVIIFVFTIMGYIQDSFINGKMQRLDGRIQEWDERIVVTNAFIWITVCLILIGIFIICKFNKNCKTEILHIMSVIAVCLTCTQLLTTGYLAVTNPREGSFYQLTDEGIFELGDEDNIVIFILDWYDEQILDAIVEEDPEFLKPLDGFTWYRNQTSRYAFTHMSVPYLLTGIRWQEGMTEYEYTNTAFRQGTFLKDLNDLGYNIGLYTEHAVVRDDAGIVTNFERTRGYCDIYRTIKVMSKCSRYGMMPFCLKRYYYYTAEEISEMLRYKNEYYLYNYPFYKHLCDDKLKVDAEGGKKFRFYHINGCHDRDIDEEIRLRNMRPSNTYSCGKGVLKIVYTYIDELKKAGLYDNTTVIITADHGQNCLIWPNDRAKRRLYKNTSNPILFIKEKGERGDLKISDAPVSHDEFCASIIEYAGGDKEAYGRTYTDIGEKEERVREMDFYWTGVVPYKRYYINGPVTDPESWSK
ncbi:MAG: sulfatase-like hydrolase/transferase [Lachnospiraceae bacterium]|nr:sulfatase-like hydrolase/transferase [Lachnospiraceae bacterium]